MKNTFRLTLASLAGVILAVAAWGLTPATTHGSTHPTLTNEQTPAATQSVSGKIASVAKDSFTLTVASNQTSTGQQLTQQAEPKTMTFFIDKNTAMEGKLKVNANAEVTYREENGKNIAVSVRVAS
jgi:Cu/Ag efflux protein CusF